MADLEYDADTDRLELEHTPEAIRERIAGEQEHSYLRDGVLGAIDGAITTFAIVCGVVGGSLPGSVAVLLGFANLFADGLSMAISNFEGTRSERDLVDRARTIEARHIDEIPEAEIEEVREIYRHKGFDEEIIDEIVEVVTDDRELWIDTMVTEEWGLALESPDPVWAGLTTFGAFCVAGLVPVVPFLFFNTLADETMFAISIVATGVTFFGIGLLRGKYTDVPTLRAGVTTLLTGGTAAAVAYGIGYLLRGLGHAV